MRKKRLGAVAALLLGSSLFMVQRVIGQPATLSIEAPPAETTRAERAPAESVLSVPVFITEGEATRLLDTQLANPLYEAKGERLSLGYGEGTADILLEKTGPLAVHLRDGKAAFSLPFRFEAMIAWKGKVLQIPARTRQETFGSGALTVAVTPGLDEGWSIRLNDPAVTLRWDSKPSLTVLGQSIGVANMLSSMLDKEASKLVKRAEDALNASAKVKEHAQVQWERLHHPFRLNDAPELWLLIHPLSTGTPPVTVQDGRLTATLSLRSTLSIASERPEPLPSPPLPRLHAMPKGTTTGFLLNVEALLSYKALAAYVAREGIPPVDLPGGGTVTVDKLAFYASRGRLVAAADISGKALLSRPVSGRIYLHGTPRYDREERVLRITDLTYEENTTKGLLKAAAWLAKPYLASAIEEKLVFPLGDLRQDAMDALESAFQGQRLSPELTSDGRVASLDLDTFAVGPDGLELSFVLGGDIALEYQER